MSSASQSNVNANKGVANINLIQQEISPIRPYLESTVAGVVQKGLIELDKERPDKPLEFLGNYLLAMSKK